DPIMKQKQHHIMYQQQAPYAYPFTAEIDMEQALQTATTHVKEQSEQQKNAQFDAQQIAKDIDRIYHYYDALIAENDKRATRKGITEEKQKEIGTKTETIKPERDKQLQEIYNKANGETEIILETAIIYFVPLLEYTVNHLFRGNQKQLVLFYNPITKGFFQIGGS